MPVGCHNITNYFPNHLISYRDQLVVPLSLFEIELDLNFYIGLAYGIPNSFINLILNIVKCIVPNYRKGKSRANTEISPPRQKLELYWIFPQQTISYELFIVALDNKLQSKWLFYKSTTEIKNINFFFKRTTYKAEGLERRT